MPTNPGGIAFPSGTDVPEKLRELESERVALYQVMSCIVEGRIMNGERALPW